MKQKPTDYRNRIKALEYVNAADLTPHPGNWREHPQAQAEAMRGVLAEVGIAGALLAYRSERQGGALVVIDGHLRKDAAPQQWPVLILDVDDAEADYILSTHDPLAAMATADAGALDALLSSVQSGEAAVQAMLAELAEGAGLYAPKDDSDAEPQIDRAEELRQEWGVEPGQLWRLPSRTPGQEHRLICGDCTDAAVVERVMGGEVPLLMVTDPPYGVEYDATWRGKAGHATMGANRTGKVVSDDRSDWREAWMLFPGDVAYIWHGGLMSAIVAESILSSGFDLRAQIIWNKSVMVMGRGDYHWKHEPCHYAVRQGGTAHWSAGRDQTTVWDLASPIHIMSGSKEEKTEHPTQKPLECMARPIRNHDSPLVYDPFLGSGTTLIAAENLSRQCRAVEISPAYCAVALQRYVDAFGIRGELIA